MQPEVFTDLNVFPLQFVLSSLAVVVEDSASSCSVTVKVFPKMTTAALKQQVSHEKEERCTRQLDQTHKVTVQSIEIAFLALLHLVPPEDVCRLWLSPSGAALGDWAMSVR